MNYQHHVLLISPDAPDHWFFEIAGDYWSAFRPIVTRSLDLLECFSEGERLLLTILCPPEQAEPLLSAVFSYRSTHNTAVDLVVAEDDAFARAILQRRILKGYPIAEGELRFDETA